MTTAMDSLLRDICNENIKTRLRPTLTNDRSAPVIRIDGEKLKNFNALDSLPSEMALKTGFLESCYSLTSIKTNCAPPPPPPLPPSLNAIKFCGKSDQKENDNPIKKRGAENTNGTINNGQNRSALMDQIKNGNFKLRKVGATSQDAISSPSKQLIQTGPHNETGPNEARKIIETIVESAAIEQITKPDEQINEKIGKIKISPIFQQKLENSPTNDQATTDIKKQRSFKVPLTMKPSLALSENGTLNDTSQKWTSDDSTNSSPTKKHFKGENGADFKNGNSDTTDHCSELKGLMKPQLKRSSAENNNNAAREIVSNALAQKMSSESSNYQKLKLQSKISSVDQETVGEKLENEKLPKNDQWSNGGFLRNAESIESLSSGSISLYSEVAESTDSKTSNGSKVSMLKLNFQGAFIQNCDKSTPARCQSPRVIGNYSPSKFCASLSRMKSMELLPTTDNQKLKVCKTTDDESATDVKNGKSSPNFMEFPKVGTLKNRFENSSLTSPDNSPTKANPPKTIAALCAQNFKENLEHSVQPPQKLKPKKENKPDASIKATKNEHLFTATPIFVNLSKNNEARARKNASPDSGHSSPRRGPSPVLSSTGASLPWIMKKDTSANNLFTDGNSTSSKFLEVSKTLEFLHKRAESALSPENNNNSKQKSDDDVVYYTDDNSKTVSSVLTKPLQELRQYQFQIDLCNGTNEMLRLEKRVSN